MVESLREAFSLFDKNKDGHITASEIAHVFTSLGMNVTETELRDLINESDVNSNGEIEFDEFLAIMTSSHSDPEQELRQAFDMFDLNKSGAICKSELKTMMTALGENLSDKDLEKVIDSLDTDKNGEISFEGS